MYYNNDFNTDSTNELPEKCRKEVSGEEVVISGISGVFPASKNVLEFMENLNEKVDMVSKSKSYNGCGKIDDITKFDATFFRVPYKQAIILDPISRILLEHAYGAIFDAGINPTTLKGRKIGVFIGSSYYDNSYSVYDVSNKTIYAIMGNATKSMFANRISYWIDSKGPSYNIDSVCSSSMVCLDQAIRSIKRGECESAIVGGANLCIHPTLTKNIESAELCSTDGEFAENYRSDAINVIFLQKLKDAKRIYAEVFYTQVGYSLKSESEFLPVRKSADIEKSLADFFSQANISPGDVEYFETHDAGGNNIDELEAIIKVFKENEQIKIGNVKAFMGNSEAASGICALTKICLAYHNGKIAAELFPELQRRSSDSTKNKNRRLTQEIHNFDRGFAAINNFSFGGLDAQVLVKSHYKKKQHHDKVGLPTLVFASGRNEACVNKFFDILKSAPLDAEQIALIHNIHNTDIPGHTYRGYTILESDEKGQTTALSQGVELYSGKRRPLCFVYSGMGSQWPEMGKVLLRIPTFAAAINRCAKVLKPKGVDIIEILTKPDPHLFDNILNSFVAIVAVQIGLTDLLYEMNIFPDFIIGHSLGELGCGYADGCLTAEETILAGYYRGLVSIQTPFIHGAMAAVGLGYREVTMLTNQPFGTTRNRAFEFRKIKRLCPTEIEVACHNSSTSSTISGPSGAMKKFVRQLRSQGIFAKEVLVSNIAYHSKYIEHAGPPLLEHLKDLIKTRKLRSQKWLCTSLPPTDWNNPAARYSSAEYHTNNVLNRVYFQESAQHIPPEAIVVELAPHGLMQAILKRSHPNCLHISLTKRWHSNPLKFLMECFGKLYQVGFNPQVHTLYPKIEYPVSTGTPMLSHLVGWNHTEEWSVVKHKENDKIRTPARDLFISFHDDQYRFLNSYVRNGKNILPEAAILFFVWETLARFRDEKLADTSVVFKDVIFCSEVVKTTDGPLKLSIMINKGLGFLNFEVCYRNINVVNGLIEVTQTPIKDQNYIFPESRILKNSEHVILKTEDIYRMLHYRGLKLRTEFHSIVSIDHKTETAFIKCSNWIILIDSLLQLKILGSNYTGVSIPKFITELAVDTDIHKTTGTTLVDGINCHAANISSVHLPFRCAGITLNQVIFENLPVNESCGDIIEELLYVPHKNNKINDIDQCLRIILQIVTDNAADSTVNIYALQSDSANIFRNIEHVIDTMIDLNFNINVMDENTFKMAIKNNEQTLLVVVDDFLENEKKLTVIEHLLPETTFILSSGNNKSKIEHLMHYDVISTMELNNKTLLLLKKSRRGMGNSIAYINIRNEDAFTWIQQLSKELNESNEVILVSEDPYSGLLGFVRKLNKIWKKRIRLFQVDDYHTPTLDLRNEIFQRQLNKNLSINIYKQSQWGGYYFLPIQKTPVIGKVTLTLINTEDIETLAWVELKTDLQTCPTMEVHFAGLSMHDYRKALGEVTSEQSNFGMEFSGLDEGGNKVMGLINSGALSTTIEADNELLWPVPMYWSLEDAATVPLPYVYAYYCLMIKSKLRYGQTVFVNSGTGAIGQAVISTCLNLNCDVYTTVSDYSKKMFLLKLFPKLKANNIYDSKDACFFMWLRSINPKRCDFVINSASGCMKQAAMKCVGSIGIFLNISDQDKFINEDLGVAYLDEDRNYINVNIGSLFHPDKLNERKLLRHAIAEGIANGTVRPLSRYVCPSTDVRRAFKLLSSRRLKGRMLIQMKGLMTSNNPLTVIPSASYSSKGVYIVICDENQLGIELADYLVRRGITILNIHHKPKSNNGYLNEKIKTWRALGVKANVIASKLDTNEDFVNVIQQGNILGTIAGIFIVQNTSHSNSCKLLDQREFVEKFKETASVVTKLDMLSRSYCTELSSFVVITQETNNIADEYVAAVCEKICESRKGLGLPGLALRAHLIDQFPHQNDNRSKMEPQPIQTIFKTMDRSLKLNSAIVHTFNIKRKQQSDDKCERKDYEFRTFYKFIENDEVMANEPVVRMRTLLSTEAEVSSNQYLTDSCLMLIPGFEGHHQIFNSLCEGLKINSIVLQLGPDLIEKSITEMALSIRKFMKKINIQSKSKFYLLGYLFGVNVALELANLLEKEGLKGIVYCLDSSPDILKNHLNTIFGEKTIDQQQDYILENMLTLMNDKADHELEKKHKDWHDKVEVFASYLKGSGYSIQYTKSVMEAAYNRFNLALKYEPEMKLNSKVILIKGNHNNEHNLSRFTTQAIEVINVQTKHVISPFGSEISNIVNKYLDSDVLKVFEDHDFTIKYFMM